LVLMNQGNDRDAITVLVRALERFPDRQLWWMNLGDAYRRTDSVDDARRAYRHSLDLAEKEIARDPRDGNVRSRLAYLCARLGERTRALSEVGQALQLSPGSTDARSTVVRTYETLARREESLTVLRGSPDDVLKYAVRLRDLADLHQDSRFQQLVSSRGI